MRRRRVRRQVLAAGLLLGTLLTLTGCSPPQSGAVGLVVQGHEVHALARSCPSWIEELTGTDYRFNDLSWSVQDPLNPPAGHDPAPGRSGTVEVTGAVTTQGGLAVDAVVATVRDGALVLDDGSATPIPEAGARSVTVQAGRLTSNGIVVFLAAGVQAPAERILALAPGEVLIGQDESYHSLRTIPRADFDRLACER